MTPDEFEELRSYQVETQQQVYEVLNQLQQLRQAYRRAEQQRYTLHALSQKHGSDLVDLTQALNRLGNRVLILEQHPSNSAKAQYKRLSHKGRTTYLASVGSVIAGTILLVLSGGVEYSSTNEGMRVNFNEVPAPLMVMGLGLLLGKQAVDKELSKRDAPSE